MRINLDSLEECDNCGIIYSISSIKSKEKNDSGRNIYYCPVCKEEVTFDFYER